ncbi:MAG: RloB domain-containing protein [Paludibacteraceae bacterium]|nr:RloB domain-containing protein [Paludibacteraceae bacterium]
MARRKIKIEPQPAGFVLIADGETEQWYIELMKKHYNIRVKLQPELSCHSIEMQYELVEESIEKGYDHVFWIIDFDSIQKENNEAKNKGRVLQKFKDVYLSAIGKTEKDSKWKGRLTIIVNNPCLEYWFYLHQHPESNRYFAQYETDLLPALRKFDVGGGLFDKYNKSKQNYLGNPNLFERLLPHLKNIDFQRLRQFDFDTCETEGVSEMYKLFRVLGIDERTK